MAKENIIIYCSEIPQPYGNLKTMCEDLGVPYNSFKSKSFPFEINNIKVHKIPIIKGSRTKR